MVTGGASFGSMTFFCLSNTGPLGWTGQPRCAQRFEMIVKLGTPSETPLLRMYAVRRDTSPCFGSRRNVAITNFPSGKSSNGPRSTLLGLWFTNAGATMNPRAGTATRPPITAPRPSVVPSRNTDRE